jgi:drug/metabolite transporter (DMT)-like permease
MPLAVFVFKEKTTGLKWLGFILGLIGVIILFNPSEINWSNHQVLFGNGILLIASFSWAIAILCSRNMKWHHTPLELISWQLTIGAILLLITAFWIDPPKTVVLNMTLINALLFSGIFATAFAYWGVTVISKELPSTTASLSFLAVPVVGLIFSALILHEPITPTILFAMLTILFGIVCVAFSGKRSKNKIDMRMD